MANLHTPLTNTPIVDWNDTAVGPDVPQSMLNAINSLERYTNVPVVDSPDRETKMPLAGRYVGQVTYNAATDSYEYWNGTKWATPNKSVNMLSTVNIASNPGVSLDPGDYYDYRAALNITTPCQVTIIAKANASAEVGPLTWAGFAPQLLHNDVVWGGLGAVNTFYPANVGGGFMDSTSFGRFSAAPGAHTFGLRVAVGGTVGLNLNFVNVLLLRSSTINNSAAGVNAAGDW